VTEVIQPRPVSLFEPPPAVGWSASVDSFGLETADDEQASGKTVFDTPSLAQPPVGLPAAPVTSLIRPSDPGQQPGGSSAIPGWLPSQPTGPPPPIEKSEIANRKFEIKWPPSQPGPGPAPPQTPGPVLLPAAAQPSATRAPGQPDLDRPTLTPGAARNETDTAPPRSAPEGQPQPVLEPTIQHVVVERVATPEVRRPAAARDESSAAPPRSAAWSGQRQPTLEPAIQQIVVERAVSPEEPPPTTAPRPEPLSVETTRPLTPATVVAQPHVTPYVEPAAPVPAEPAATPGPTPTIQVTIGRVEVQATPPAPTPKNQRPKPPVMSLDEYLRQRTNRGNR